MPQQNDHENLGSSCLFDWDGTLRKGFLLYDWARFLERELDLDPGVFSALFELRASFENGQVSYDDLVAQSGYRYAAALNKLGDFNLSALEAKFVRSDWESLFTFTAPLLTELHNYGHQLVVISGAPQRLLAEFVKYLPIDKVFGLELSRSKSADAMWEVSQNAGLLHEKRRVVEQIRQGNKYIYLAVGNADTDLPLFEHADHSFLLEDEEESRMTDVRRVKSNDLLREVRGVHAQALEHTP
jgi:phosphoserine phosphatase